MTNEISKVNAVIHAADSTVKSCGSNIGARPGRKVGSRYKPVANPKTKVKGRKHREFNDRLPVHIGDSFVAELDTLVDSLVSTYGDPKVLYLREHLLSKYADNRLVSEEERKSNAIKNG
jgi:hypothetical protein